MSSNGKHPSKLNRARRHFLGAAAAAGARVAAMGLLTASIFPGSKAQAFGRNWGRHRGKDEKGACFLRGTSVLTARGTVRIEDLRPGDLVKTFSGRTMPVRWIGHRAYKRNGPTWHANIAPVRIARHSLDGRTPHSDLYLSPNHALYIDGALIEARYLVNGHSIAVVAPSAEKIEYFNILLDQHDVIFAEGVAVETFLMENGNQELFSNFAELDHLTPPLSHVTMRLFAPRPHYSGSEHVKALLQILARPFGRPHHPIADAYERFADRVI